MMWDITAYRFVVHTVSYTHLDVYKRQLHYAPCGVDGKGFQVAVVLPKGTNYPLTSKHARVHNNIADSEDALLAATNKWLIGHEEGLSLIHI